MIGFVVYIAANLGLALQDSYAALLALRCLQSAGSSGMTTIATAVITDCITSAERGHYMGYTAIGTVLGPSLSPILGGVLSQFLGWRAIFWFLLIFGLALFILMLVFFPETGRKIVGDGSLPPPKWNKSVAQYLSERRQKKIEGSDSSTENANVNKPRMRFPNPLASLQVLADKEQFLLLFYSSIIYAGYYAITATITTQFADIYGLNDLEQGLCFIPISIGGILALVTNGKFDPVDGNYRRYAKKLGMPLTRNRHQDLTDFPIERARIEVVLPLLYVGALFIIGYGWLIEKSVNLAAPLVFLAFIGFTTSGAFKVVTVFNVDIAQSKPATAAAAFNLIRCLFGAASTALVNPVIKAWGRGWTFTFIGLLEIGLSPLAWVIYVWGHRWRKEKMERIAAQKRHRQEQMDSSTIENGRAASRTR